MVERESSALPPLPLPIVLAIFALLPVDQRLLCRAVCRGWRAVLGDVSLWLRLDFTHESGGVTFEVTDALLRAAAARAAGRLQAMDALECDAVTHPALLTIVRSNAGLRELRVCHGGHARMAVAEIEELLRAAPQLVELRVDADGGTLDESRRMLRKEGVFAPLRLRTLWCTSTEMAGLTEGELVALAADLASHTLLLELGVFFARLDTPAALDALVDVALTRQMTSLRLVYCRLSPASAPALARLLGSHALKMLTISGRPNEFRLLDAAGSATLGAALRANGALQVLNLAYVDFWHEPAVARELLRALSTCRDLILLALDGNAVSLAHRAAAGAALAEYAAAAAALKDLDVSACHLGDDGLGPLFDALPGNTHLRTLSCHANGVSEAFVRDRVLPAVRANRSLLELDLQLPWDCAREAEAAVEAHWA